MTSFIHANRGFLAFIIIIASLFLITGGVSLFYEWSASSSLSVAQKIKIVSTNSDYRVDHLLRTLPDQDSDAVLYSSDININNRIDDISAITHSVLAYPLFSEDTSSTSIDIPHFSDQQYFGEGNYKLAKRITKNAYGSIAYDSNNSAIVLEVGGDKFKILGKEYQTEKKVISKIENVSERGILEIGGNYIKISRSMDVPIKLSIAYNSPITIYNEIDSRTIESFEDAIWQNEPTDCSDTMSGEAQMGIAQVNDATDGARAMKLTSSNHYACAFHTFPVALEDDKVYKLQFDYKNLTGGNVMYYYDLKNENGERGYAFSEQFSGKKGEWKTHETYINPDKIIDHRANSSYSPNEESSKIVGYDGFSDKSPLHEQEQSGKVSAIFLYFYAPSNGVNKVENIYDGIKLITYKMESINKFNIKDSLEANIELGDGIVILNFPAKFEYVTKQQNINMLDSPSASFEDAIWQNEPTDCSDTMSGEAQMSIAQVNDATDGARAMKLTSSNHYACAFHTFPVALEDDKVYKLQFDYKNLTGGNVMYYYDLKSNTQDLSKSKTMSAPSQEWQKADSILDTSLTQVKALTIALYAPSNGNSDSSIVYDNLSLIELTKKDISSYYLYAVQGNKEATSTAIIKRNMTDKSKFTLEEVSSPVFVLLGTEYSNIMRVTIKDNSVIDERFHYKMNGYTNGWYVDPVALCGTKGSLNEGCTLNPDSSYNIELIIEFTPQRWFYIGLIISSTTLLSCLSYLGYDFIRSRRRRGMYHR